MKTRMQPIDMISFSMRDGSVKPLRFRYENREESCIVRVKSILACDRDVRAGNPMLKFDCQSVISGTEKRYQLHYELNTRRWYLYLL